MDDELGWQEIGRRFREARLAAGLSQEQLGTKAKMDRTAIAKIESGARRVDAVELLRLARTLELPLGHFITPEPAVISRRSSPAETATRAEHDTYHLDAALGTWLRDVRQLTVAGILQPRPLHSYPGKVAAGGDARDAAKWLRCELKQGEAPIESLVEVAESAGVQISLTEIAGEGASLVDDGLAVAVVSTRGDHGRRRTTAAHELGHLVLGDDYSSDLGVHASRDERESLIEAFAAEFLLPAVVIERVSEFSREALIELAARYRVSWSLAVKQAQKAGRVAQADVHRLKSNTPTLVDFRDSLGWAPQPDLEAIRVPPGFKHAVTEAVRRGMLTPGRASEMTRGEISAEDFEQFESEPGL